MMKRLSSYIVSLYLVFTIVPVAIMGTIWLANNIMATQQKQANDYQRVVEQQVVRSKIALESFDLPLAESIVGELSELHYVGAVQIMSDVYQMKLAESRKSFDASGYMKIDIDILSDSGEKLGTLSIQKDKSIWSNVLLSSYFPQSMLFVVTICIVSFLFSQRILTTLNYTFMKIQNLASAIEKGNYKQSITVENEYEETDAIYRSLESMRQRLAESVEELQLSEERHSRTYNLTQVCLFVFDMETNKVIRSNREFDTQFQDVVTANDHLSGEVRHRFLDCLNTHNENSNFEFSLLIKGNMRTFHVTRSPQLGDEVECSAMDITELVEARSAIEQQLLTDSLTNIPNRLSFNRLMEKVEQGRIADLTLLMIDLNGFKQVNDNYGHSAGDTLLNCVAERLSNITQGKGTVYRLGGDEFIVSIEGSYCKLDIETLANDILLKIKAPVEFKGVELQVSGSIGVCTYERDVNTNNSIDEVFHRADVAMYQAKSMKAGVIFDERCHQSA